jgi:hypothetical protein
MDNTVKARQRVMMETVGLIDLSVRGNEGYAAVKHPDMEAVFCMIFIFRYSEGELCTKTCTELDGPFCWNCPQRIMKQLTAPLNERAADWRDACRLAAKLRKARYVYLERSPHGTDIRLVEKVANARSVYREMYTGELWRLRVNTMMHYGARPVDKDEAEAMLR